MMIDKPQLLADSKKSIVIMLFLYSTIYIILRFLEFLVPSDTCNPGLGFIIGLFLIPISWIVLMIYAINKIIKGNKGYWLLIGLNLLILLFFLIKVKYKN